MDPPSNKILSSSATDDRVAVDRDNFFPGLQTIDGVLLSSRWNYDDLRSALRYVARADDIFIVTYPRSGTAWTQNIVYLLLTGGQSFDRDILDYEVRTPFLEMVGKEAIEHMRRPGTIKTHLLLNYVPYNEKAKYICVIRNPKDACNSFYRFLTTVLKTASNFGFDHFFEAFMDGQLDFGDYYSHLRSIWCRKNDQNVLILFYEEMKSDMQSAIRRIADFLNIPLDSVLLERVVKYSSFSYMKEHYDEKRNAFYAHPERYELSPYALLLDKSNPIKKHDMEGRFDLSMLQHIRQGSIGDGSNAMTCEQSDRIENKLRQAMQGTGFLKYLSAMHIHGWPSPE